MPDGVTNAARQHFIRANTIIARPSLVPELRLHLATAITPIWEATEAALAERGLPPPFWAFAWPGGLALARLLLDQPAWVAGRRVLDLGAGSGVSAIAAARVGARAAASDIDPFARAAIRLNAALNEVEVATPDANLILEGGAGWDVILAGDVCYEGPMSAAVLAWLTDRAHDGACVLLADPGRTYAPKAGFAKIAQYDVPTSLELEDRETRATWVGQWLP